MNGMAKKKHSALGKRLIAAAKEMVAHAKGELELEGYEVRVPPQVDVIAIPETPRTLSSRIRQALRIQPALRSGLGAGPAETRERRAGVPAGDRARAEGGG